MELALSDAHLALMARLEELATYSHTVLQQFPKLERHHLSADIRASLAQMLRLVVMGWKRHHKKTTLAELDVEVEMLRVLVRRAFSLQYINAHRYEIWSRHTNEIGRMVGGWLKHQAQP